MVLDKGLITCKQFVLGRYYRSASAISIVPLAILIISFFYCLPLGRFSLGGFDSDFRIFDFAIVFAFGFYLTKPIISSEISFLFSAKPWFLKWLKFIIILIPLSILVAILYSGLSFILPTLIRAFRFIAYLLVPFLVFAVVRTKSDYMLLFRLLFWLMGAVGTVAFLQGLSLLPNFWPDYWRIMYSENDAPVATLSPHHKHIGVVMLIGVCIGIGYLLLTKSFWLKIIIAVVCLIMFTVPLFAGTRTYLLGFLGVIPAILLVGRGQAIIPILLMIAGSLIFIRYSGDSVSGRVERKFDERVTGRIEKLGYEGLYRERTIIYLDIFETIGRMPYLLVTGTGYQNIFRFVGANGAHNNYLQVLMELGLIGFFAFISFLIVLGKNLREVSRVVDRDVAIIGQYTWVGLCGVLLTMFVGETFWGQAAMFTLAGQLSFLFGLAVSPLYWLRRYESQYKAITNSSKLSHRRLNIA